MAHSNQARKRNRQSIARNDHNRSVKSDLRSTIKKYRTAMTARQEGAAELLKAVESKLDKAAKRNIIPHTRANRLKSRLKRAAVKA